MSRLILATALGCLAPHSTSDDSVVFTELTGKYVESLQPIRPVSGDLVAGFMGTIGDGTEPPQVVVWIPEVWKDATLCLLIRSRDGRYEGYQEFTPGPLQNTESGMFQTVLLSDASETDFLEQHAQQLALLTYRGVCGATPEEITLAFWGERPATDTTGIIQYLNTKRADEAFIYYSDLDLEEPCAQIPDRNRQVYDFSCQIPAASILISGRVQIEVILLRLGNFDDADEYVLYFPEVSQ